MASEPQVIYVQSESKFSLLWLILILSVLGGIGYYIWSKYYSKAPALPGSQAGSEVVLSGSTSGSTNTWNTPEVIAPNTSYTTPPSSGGGILTELVNAVLPSTTFPLKLATGAELHKVNQYVKDVQQYCNKFGGTNLDLDGSFGHQTELAVSKVFGTTTVSKEQYNSKVAPAIGKSLV